MRPSRSAASRRSIMRPSRSFARRRPHGGRPWRESGGRQGRPELGNREVPYKRKTTHRATTEHLRALPLCAQNLPCQRSSKTSTTSLVRDISDRAVPPSVASPPRHLGPRRSAERSEPTGTSRTTPFRSQRPSEAPTAWLSRESVGTEGELAAWLGAHSVRPFAPIGNLSVPELRSALPTSALPPRAPPVGAPSREETARASGGLRRR